MPFWVMLLIKFALKFGYPWLEKHVPAEIAKMIEELIGQLSHVSDQSKALKAMRVHMQSFKSQAE